MCAIFGLVTQTEESLTEDRIRTFTRTMTHRGPDDEGYFIEPGVALGHRRLSIIDLEGGHQPMFLEDRSVCVVFNGEVYNFRTIRKTLEKEGHRFNTRSDTEVILRAYQVYGLDCFEHFHGMFAIAIWDRARKRLVLARDRVGKKPLYYCRRGKGLVFASEAKALFESGWVSPEVNDGMLDFYLTLGYVPGPETLFKGILKLEPGHALVMEAGNVRTFAFWQFENHPVSDMDFNESCAKLKDLLFESVELRLVSDVPLGVFLSGGLDSSSIVACMSRLGTKPIKTFSVGYNDEEGTSELGTARIVADRFKTEHHEFRLEPMDFFDSLDLLLKHTEEPIIEASGVPLYQISKMAKDHVTVLLSGEGGDELFAGYDVYPRMLFLERVRTWMPFLPFAQVRQLSASLGVSEKWQKYLDWLAEPKDTRYYTVSSDLTQTVKRRLYSDAFMKRTDGRIENYFSALVARGNRKTFLSQMLYVDTKTWLADDLLLKGDKMTMAASVETRCPFLDHRLVEFAASLPDKYKLNGKTGKFILKQVMKNVLPPEVIGGVKKGFPLPLNQWFRGPLYKKTRDILTSDRCLSRGTFRPEYVTSLLDRHRHGRQDLSRRIFLLLVLELWYRKYID